MIFGHVLAAAADVEGSGFFCPFEGGTLQLSGALGGRPSFASNSASPSVKAATCAISDAISASFCACEKPEMSGPASLHAEIQFRRLRARPCKGPGVKSSDWSQSLSN